MELDALFHGADWTPREAFEPDLVDAIACDAWVLDGNYQSRVRHHAWPRTDIVIWLDLPRRVVFPSLLARTLRRAWSGEELWNGNHERWRNLVKPRPEDNLLFWTWREYPNYRASYAAAQASQEYAHIHFEHVRHRSELPALLTRVTGQ